MNARPEPKTCVWILNHYAATPDMPGGTRDYDLARHLVKRGYDVTIFASSFHYWLRRETRLGVGEATKIEEVDGIKFVWLKTFPYRGNDWRRAVNMVSYMLRAYYHGRRIPRLDSRIPRPDVIVGSTVHLLAVLSACWLASHFHARFVMEVRDLWPQTPLEMGKLSRKSPITWGLRVLERYLYRRAEKIITLLPNAADYIASLGIPRDKVVWIPSGVDVSLYDAPGAIHRDSARFTIMYAGAHGEANSLDVLLRAARIVQDRRFPTIHFVLVGDGPEKPNLIALAKELALENVEFREVVPQESVPALLREADGFVVVLKELPLYRYGTSLTKFYTYMAAAKPILLAGDSYNNIVEEAGCGLTIPPNNPEALADGVARLYEMTEEQRQAMGERGWQHVKERYDWSLLAERLHQCLESVTSKKGPDLAARS